jgi:hypothetical protein
VSASGGRWTAIVSVASGQGGYNPGHLVIRDTVPLTRPQVDSLFALLSAATFWSAPTDVRVNGADGAEWVFEFLAGSKYLLRNRWSPQASDPFSALGKWFIQLVRHPDVSHYLY